MVIDEYFGRQSVASILWSLPAENKNILISAVCICDCLNKGAGLLRDRFVVLVVTNFGTSTLIEGLRQIQAT